MYVCGMELGRSGQETLHGKKVSEEGGLVEDHF
jgi:hypothetical protein